MSGRSSRQFDLCFGRTPMADIGLIALTIVLFGLVALVVKGVERL